jgi:hypothetical protein
MSGHRIPAWRVTLDGRDLTARLAPRLLELTLSEQRAGEADQLDLRIHDHDGRLALPSRGAELSVALGWQGGGLVDKGRYRVDEVEHAGPPDIVTVRARSADLTAALRARRDRSWHDTTLGEVLRSIAGEHGLSPRIAPALDALPLPHLDQSGESDAALLTRLGKQHDAVATIKAGRLLFLPTGKGETASGEPLPAAQVRRRDGDGHRYHVADREAYSGVRAYWHDVEGANRRSVLVGKSGNAKRLRDSFASEQAAREAAEAEWARIQRGLATLSLTLAWGRPDLYPEQPCRVSGFKPEIDDTDWLIVKVTHSVGSSGFVTSLELETRADAAGAGGE